MSDEQVSYKGVEKDGVITAIWEMKGKKHIRTIDPRSQEGKRLLSGYKSEETAKSETAHK